MLKGKHTLARSNMSALPVGVPADSDSICILDTGVGLAFARVNRLDLLTDHCGDRVEYVNAVYAEWEYRARTPPSGCEARKEDFQLHQAAKQVLDRAEALWGPPVNFYPEPDELEAMKAAIVANKDIAGGASLLEHGGEAESILYVEELRARGASALFLATNDGPAIDVAAARCIRAMHQQQMLVAMCQEERLTSEEAKKLFTIMNAMTTVSPQRLDPWP